MKSLISTGLVLALAYAAIVAAAYLFQRALMYFPDTRRIDPAHVGLQQAREEIVPAADGTPLVLWRIDAAPGQATILYFQGNGAGLANRAERFAAFAASGFGVAALGYPGYSGSGGRPSEASLVAAAQSAYDHLRATGVNAEDIVVYGESLGSGVAVQLAAAQPVAAVVLEAPFTSAADVAASVYWFLPVRWLMQDRFDSLSRIGNIKAPLLVLHGRHDSVVPYSFGERLFAAAKEPKSMISLNDDGHVMALRQSVLRFIVEFIGKSTYSP